MDVKFEPCGHAVMCAECAQRAKKCPICKVSTKYIATICFIYILNNFPDTVLLKLHMLNFMVLPYTGCSQDYLQAVQGLCDV